MSLLWFRTIPRSRCALLLAVLSLNALPTRASDSPVAVDVKPYMTFVGGSVRTTIRTLRDTRNRELRVVVEAAQYYASSDVQLNGADAPVTHQFVWKTLPGGAYRVEATLLREDGELKVAAQCFTVVAEGDEVDAGNRVRETAPGAGKTSAPGCS